MKINTLCVGHKISFGAVLGAGTVKCARSGRVHLKDQKRLQAPLERARSEEASEEKLAENSKGNRSKLELKLRKIKIQFIDSMKRKSIDFAL